MSIHLPSFPIGEKGRRMFRTEARSGAWVMVVKICPRRFSFAELVCCVVPLDNRGPAIREENLIGLGLLRSDRFGRSPASVSRWVSSVLVT